MLQNSEYKQNAQAIYEICTLNVNSQVLKELIQRFEKLVFLLKIYFFIRISWILTACKQLTIIVRYFTQFFFTGIKATIFITSPLLCFSFVLF